MPVVTSDFKGYAFIHLKSSVTIILFLDLIGGIKYTSKTPLTYLV